MRHGETPVSFVRALCFILSYAEKTTKKCVWIRSDFGAGTRDFSLQFKKRCAMIGHDNRCHLAVITDGRVIFFA